VTNMYNMFSIASTFNKDISGLELDAIVDNGAGTGLRNMLNNSGLSTANYDATLIGWNNDVSTPNTLTLGANTLTYCASETDRNNLVGTKGWTINGDSKDCSAPPENDFVITIKTDNTGPSSDTQFTIPTTGGGYNYNVD